MAGENRVIWGKEQTRWILVWSWSGILGIFRAWVGGDPVVDHGVGSCVMIVRNLDPGGRTRVSDGWLECLKVLG